ncbi:MAG: DNA polymerase ligase N-terminal domain-containing protein [Candidatus Altiarchaeota archaeon]|nr:DNA polymerase ligase N-terminal domain-containing protein [Candidatus Altiarchaeota archaeon]
MVLLLFNECCDVMALEEYQKKRDFGMTTEPEGGGGEKKEGLIFVVQRHDSRRLHYDLRLERGGVLESWAVPKGIPLKEGVKRMAVKTEDHPLGYASFEGIIPEGEYGAGSVEIWDKGALEINKWGDGEIVFIPHGEKINCPYVLIKMKPSGRFPGEDNWLLFRKKSK